MSRLLLLVGFLLPAEARTQEPVPEEPAPAEMPAASETALPEVLPTPSAKALYEQARAALDQNDRDHARTLLRRMRRHHATAMETAALAQLLGQAEPAEEYRLQWRRQERGGASHRHAVELREPISRATGERLTPHNWEMVDFVITSLSYGTGVGTAYAVGLTGEINAIPMLLGAFIYGGLATTLVANDNTDRGDLPLTLAISGYVPLTALLAGVAAEGDDEDIGLAVALSGTAALPIAAIAAAYTDLDPGDVQLIRDAAFWGMILGLTGTAGLGCRHGCEDATYGLAGLAGLYAGAGAGALLALNTEISLERVRLITLSGYGGAVVGSVFGAVNFGDEGALNGVTVGSVLGMFIGSVATMWFDEPVRVSAARLVMMPVVDRQGALVPAVGLHLFADELE